MPNGVLCLFPYSALFHEEQADFFKDGFKVNLTFVLFSLDRMAYHIFKAALINIFVLTMGQGTLCNVKGFAQVTNTLKIIIRLCSSH